MWESGKLNNFPLLFVILKYNKNYYELFYIQKGFFKNKLKRKLASNLVHA